MLQLAHVHVDTWSALPVRRKVARGKQQEPKQGTNKTRLVITEGGLMLHTAMAEVTSFDDPAMLHINH